MDRKMLELLLKLHNPSKRKLLLFGLAALNLITDLAEKQPSTEAVVGLVEQTLTGRPSKRKSRRITGELLDTMHDGDGIQRKIAYAAYSLALACSPISDSLSHMARLAATVYYCTFNEKEIYNLISEIFGENIQKAEL